MVSIIDERPFEGEKGGGALEDSEIVALFWARSEDAIAAANGKYGAYCYTVAHNILTSHEDSEECVSDTWLRAWNAIPPQRPGRLAAFFAKITRNLAINRSREQSAEKRGGGALQLALDELSECVASSHDVEREYSRMELERDINRFLRALPARECDVFMSRYFFVEPTETIARRYGMRQSNVYLILSRTRGKLRKFLLEEGYLYDGT